jgi:hypothetical protein
MVRTSLVCALIASMIASPAAAHARASVKMTLPSSADQGQAAPLTWRAKALPHGARVVLQRRMGTANVWKTIKTLHGSAGSTKAPALNLGAYRLRVAAVGPHRKVYAQQQRALKVFGSVPLGTLVARFGQTGTNVTPTRTFPYVYKVGDLACCGGLSDTGFAVSAPGNPCRSVHLEITSDGASYTEGPPDTATVTLVQQSADPMTTAPITPTDIGTLDAALAVGQSWALKASMVAGHGYVRLYLNGSASCYATTLTPASD